MPRRSSKRRGLSQPDEEEERPQSRHRRKQPKQELYVQEEPEDDDDDRAEEEFMFSQQVPEMSQNVAPEKANERRNLENMDPAARDKALTSVSRLILMKALERQPIDRLKLTKDAGISESRIASAAFQEAADRLRNVFGFELKRIPKFMEEQKSMPKRFKDRFYVLNQVADSDSGAHSKAIHSVHADSAMEKGLLLLTLALIFCKGESHADGSRWALGRDLYRLLHSMDDSIPEEPPQQGTARAKTVHQKSRLRNANNMTPNVDYLLEKFVQQDYLIKEKATEENFATQTLEEGDFLYSMGPRAAMEVGRKQVIHFCAEILDEEPDPTMLQEVEADADEDDEAYMEPFEQTQ